MVSEPAREYVDRLLGVPEQAPPPDIESTEMSPEQRPIMPERVVTSLDDESMLAFCALAQLAHEGRPHIMEEALAQVAKAPRSSHHELDELLALIAMPDPEDPVKAAQAAFRLRFLRPAIRADELGLAASVDAALTPAAREQIRRDPAHAALVRRTQTDRSAPHELARIRDFHLLGRAARLAAGR